MQYYSSAIGMWYNVFYDSKKKDPFFFEHHWIKETRSKPVEDGYYAADDPDKLYKDFSYFKKIGIDYLILDDTNNHFADNGNIAEHIDACFKAAKDLGDRAPKICFAGGRPLIDGDEPRMQEEMNIFYDYYERYPQNTFIWKGKPLFVNFNYEFNYCWQDGKERFTMRPAAGGTFEGAHVAHKRNLDKTGMYGWIFNYQYPSSEVYGVTPGFSRSHNDLGTILPAIPRKKGARYQREWLNAVRRKPEMIVISSWNDHSEETGIEAVHLLEAVEGRDSEEKNPFYYQQITEGYLALKTGLIDGFYYRPADEMAAYRYQDGRLIRFDAGEWDPVIVLPEDYLDYVGCKP